MSDQLQVQVDVLPPHSGVEGDVDVVERRARFRGVMGEDRRRKSLWSGWFSIDEQPIFLTWDAFEWGDPDA